MRFPPQHAVDGDPLRIVVDGLFSRGLLLNRLFVEGGAIRVQQNRCPQYSLEECRRILQGLMRDGLPVMWHEASNRRLAHSSSIPYNAPIGCDLHGHMQTVHILVESQHARWGFFDSPQYCESFFFECAIARERDSPGQFGCTFPGTRQTNIWVPCAVRCSTLHSVLLSLRTFLTHRFHREADLAPNAVYLRTRLCSLTCHKFHAYFRGHASFIWTPTTPSYHPMRHSCTVVVVVTVILFYPTGVRCVLFLTCTLR
ncbi:hypothetical protein C4B63_1g173 [Trypanosoma cruzi]|uniref:Uncharacterized protein n=1 Tax=Trypanosoma cruzi TaxID=5693 RepID=A0A2V2W651_TRYCR|nr:hypothetical protein C4B63_1g173 [Trypanosoma cruzi]